MNDLLKPIITSAEIEYCADLSYVLLQKIKDFASGTDAGIPGRGAGSRHFDNRFDYVQTASVSLFGDVTLDHDWQEKLDGFLTDSRFALCITSSFDKALDDPDLLALTKLQRIRIAIDSSSPAMMRKLRSADLTAIIANIVRLRQAMLETGKKPELLLDCTATKYAITHLGGVARLASILQVDTLNIGDAADDAIGSEDTLQDLSDAEAELLARSLIDAFNSVNSTSTRVNVLPGLKRRIEPVLIAMSQGRPVSAASFRGAANGKRDISPCMQPWNTVIVQSNGAVRLCRGPLEAVGSLRKDSLINIVNGSDAREVRERLLRGEADLPCRGCRFSTSVTPQVFRDKVRQAHEQYDAAIYPWQASVPTGMNYDTEHGIKTQARLFVSDLDSEKVGAAVEHATPYIPTPVADIDRILDAVPLPPQQSTLIDLGCGMGRVLLQAAKRPFRQIVGVELSPTLLDIAKRNLDSCTGLLACRDIVLVRADAAEYDFPSGDIIVYLFNPFTDAVLKPVVDRLSRHAGRVVIAYGAPLHAAVIDANPRFVPVNQFTLTDPRNVARVWQSHASAC